MTKTTEATTLRDLSELLAQISSATGLTQQQLETQFEDVHVTVYRFEDRNLVPPGDFDDIIDTWAKSIKTQIRVPSKIAATPKRTVATRKTTRQKAKPGKVKVAESKATVKTTAKAAAAKTRTSRSKSSLPLPENYRAVVSHLYGPSLKRIMPADSEGQRSFLEAIAQETPDGVALLKELSVLIADKYTGKMAPEAAYNGLKNKAQSLLDEMSGKRKRKVRKTTKRGKKAVTRPRRKRK